MIGELSFSPKVVRRNKKSAIFCLVENFSLMSAQYCAHKKFECNAYCFSYRPVTLSIPKQFETGVGIRVGPPESRSGRPIFFGSGSGIEMKFSGSGSKFRAARLNPDLFNIQFHNIKVIF